ncbi:hypothetical protein ACM66B_002643 [Microbotryomycetes sp. NB124-2]
MPPPGRRALPQSDSEASEGQTSPSARRQKRARVQKTRADEARASDNDDEHQRDGQDGSEDENEDEQSDVEQDNATKLVRDPADGYVMGSITRIACRNFLTYDKVEFKPGPALNMIIGPNGTGKSTIACAIAIGLGFKPEILGRSPKLESFVKIDSDGDCWVEIELKGKPGKKNLVIRRELNRNSSSSSFTIDGDQATAKQVAAQMKELDVQVTNLCTFLPQDRVASFSAMTQTQLLRETERAAGDRRLTKWHEALIQLQAEHTQLEEELKRESEKLKRRETKQAESEKEVQQFQQRRELEAKLAVVQLVILYARYNVKRAEYEEAKGLRNEAREQLNELEHANVPFRESENALKAIVKHFNTLKEQLTSRIRKTNKDIKVQTEQIAASEEAAEKARSDLTEIAAQERQNKDSIKKMRAQIASLEKKTEKQPGRVDPAPITKEIAAKTSEVNDIQAELTEKESAARSAKTEHDRLAKDEQNIQARLARTNDIVHQREKATEQFEQDTWKAVLWLRQNRSRFKGKVYEPARLNVFAKTNDREMLNLIEGPIALHAWKTFLFEEREDYDMMMTELTDRQGLRINGAELGGRDRSPESSSERLSIDDCRKLGFDCTAIDMLQGPGPVLSWLCDEHHVGRIPLQTKRRPIVSHNDMGRLNIRSYYTPDGSHSIKVAKYGQKHVQMEQRSLNPAKVLSSGGDNSRAGQLQQDLVRVVADKNERRALIVEAQAVVSDLKQRIEVLNTEKAELEKRRKDLNKPVVAFQRNMLELNTARESLQKRLNAPSAEAKRKQLQDKLIRITSKRVELVLKLKELTTKLVIAQTEFTEVMMRGMQADTDLAAMKNSSSELDRRMRETREQLHEFTEDMKKIKTEAQDAIKLIQEGEEMASAECKAASDERRQEELDLDRLIEEEGTIQAQINMTSNISEQVLRKYEELLREIAELKEKVTIAENKLEESNAQITSTRDRWLPRLRSLVNKIGEKFKGAFDRLGVLSDIQLDEVPEYSKWGIKILVSFRDNEPLQVLTAQRQSGGERALTTVMYLMSLAELAQSPFALVDEINQGMDRRVERSVHNALVATTCKDDVGQYFLLTPKLLPDLDYHEKMKVLVINAGTYIPPKLTLANIVKQKKIRNRQQQQQQQGGRAAIAAH